MLFTNKKTFSEVIMERAHNITRYKQIRLEIDEHQNRCHDDKCKCLCYQKLLKINLIR